MDKQFVWFVWFPGSRLGTSMIYRLSLRTRRSLVCRAFPGSGLGTRMVHGWGKRIVVWFPRSGLCLVPRLPPGNLHDLQARPENRGGASCAVRSQAPAWEREWCTGGELFNTEADPFESSPLDTASLSSEAASDWQSLKQAMTELK